MRPARTAGSTGALHRGQPLVVLVILLIGWALLRMETWPDGFALGEIAVVQPAARSKAPQSVRHRAVKPIMVAKPQAADRVGQGATVTVAPRRLTAGPAHQAGRCAVQVKPGGPPPPAAPGPNLAQTSAMPADLATAVDDPAAPVPPSPQRRWSADGWVLLRGPGAPAAFAAGTAGYGGSQAGAVLRYRLAPGSARRSTLYLRVSSALPTTGTGAPPSREAAAGVALRPVPRVPVAVQVEARVQDDGGTVRVRPAVLVVSELPPQSLPLGATAEVYAAAGYVAGSGATPFYDAQLEVTRPVLRLPGTTELRLGAGAWAGGQRGAHRVDVGPRAEVPLRLGAVAARVAIDYRLRLAGSAQPGSGPALTLSAGF